MTEPTQPTFRYTDQGYPLPWALGVRFNADHGAGVMMEFFVDDPEGLADYLVFQRVVVDPTALVDFASAIEARYRPPGE